MFHHVANPLVTAMFVDRFTLSKIRDWDSYCNGEGVNYPNEFRAMEQFCRDRLPGVHRLADRQKTRAAVKLQQQHKQNPNPNHGQRDFQRDKGHGRNFEHDRKRELYWVSSAATNVAHAGQQVSPPKNEAFATKLNPEARPFNSNAPAKCDFPNCNNQSGPHFLGKFPVFKSKSAFDRQKWVTAKNLCAICFKKAHTHVSQCRLLEVMKKLDRRPAHEDQESDEDNSEDQVEAVREAESASEDEKKLEPEKEKYPQNQDEEARLEYCSMEAIADRWRDKPKRQEAALTCSEVGEEADVKPVASVSGIKGKKNPTLLLSELLQIEGNLAVMQYDTGATASLVSSNFVRKLNLFSRPTRVQVSITSGLEGGPEEATLMHELFIKWPRGSAHSGQFLEV